jgi:hypothetical protein
VRGRRDRRVVCLGRSDSLPHALFQINAEERTMSPACKLHDSQSVASGKPGVKSRAKQGAA